MSRRKRGEELPQTKLTAEQVREMRHLYATTKVGYRPLAAQFGVSRTNVMDIIARRAWAWVSDQPDPHIRSENNDEPLYADGAA